MPEPTVELIARRDLHPALSDLLIAAAHELHRRATLTQRAGEFPAPLEHEYPIVGDAARYYKSGKGVAYRFVHRLSANPPLPAMDNPRCGQTERAR